MSRHTIEVVVGAQRRFPFSQCMNKKDVRMQDGSLQLRGDD